MGSQKNQKKSGLSKKAVIIFSLILLILIVIAVLLMSQKTPQKEGVTTAVREEPSPTVVITLPPKGTYLEDQLIVKYKEGRSPAELQDTAEVEQLKKADLDAGMLQRTKLLPKATGQMSLYYVVVLKKGSDLKKAMEIYQALPQVSEVQINAIVKAQ